MSPFNIGKMRSPRRLLWWKELTESKAALWVGLLVFVLVPSLWTGLMGIIDPADGLFPGFATVLWLFAGWLFAAVLGAQVVCRDLGTPIERFLLGKPIAQNQVLKVKARTGLLVIIVIALAIVAIEGFWSACEPSHRKSNTSDDWAFIAAHLVATSLTLAAFWISYAVACLTRRSLVSTLAATFALGLLVSIPLIVRIPWLPGINELIFRETNLTNTGELIAWIIVGSWCVAIVLRRIGISRERGLAVEPRHLAWMAALTLIALFAIAMNEVGASQPLSTTWWHSTWQTGKDTEGYIPFKFAAGRQRVAVSAGDRTVRLIDLDVSGRITRTRRLDCERSAVFLQEPIGVWVFDGEENIATVRNSVTTYRDGEPLSKRVRLELSMLNWSTLIAHEPILLPWPVDREFPERCFVQDAYFSGMRLFVWISSWEKKTWSGTLAVYQISEGRAVALVSNGFPSPEPWFAQFQVIWDNANGKPLRKLGLLGQYGDLAFCFDPDAPIDVLTNSIKRPSLTDRGIVLPRSDRWGLKAWIQPGSNTKGIIQWSTDSGGAVGRVRASPWATLFRLEHPRLLAAGPNRWVEMHEGHAIVYDLSDPSQPRRIAHITAPPFWLAAVTGDLLVLDHSMGISVTKLPPIEKR